MEEKLTPGDMSVLQKVPRGGPTSLDVKLADYAAEVLRTVEVMRMLLDTNSLHADIWEDLGRAQDALRRAREKLLSSE